MNLDTLRTLAAAIAGPAALMLILKLTLLLASAELAAVLLRRRAAATRAHVWLVALVGALTLAAVSPIAPRVRVPLPAPKPLAKWSLERSSGKASSAPAVAVPSAPAEPSTALRPAPQTHTAGTRVRPGSLPLAGGWSRPEGLAALWLAGACLVLLWSALAHAWLARLVREASPVASGPWAAVLADAREAGRVPAGVRLGFSAAVSSPILWGWRPTILLPRESQHWPHARRRDALLHELAHVARGDFAAQALATLTCAVFWFHPLVWRAARKLRSECEHACDDRVLAAGTEAHEYAASLLEVARGARTLRGARLVAVGMARRSTLEGRLLAVLDVGRTRATLSRRSAWLAALVTGPALLSLAALEPRLVSAKAAEQSSALPTQSLQAESFSTESVQTEPPPAESFPPGSIPSESLPMESESKHASSHKATTTTTTYDMDLESAIRESKSAAAYEKEGAPAAPIEHELAARPGELLTLELETGGNVEIQGWNEPRVTITSLMGGRDWRNTRVDANTVRGGVRLHAWQADVRGRSYSTSHDFRIRVPSRYDVRIRSAGGDIVIRDVAGTFRGSTGGGSIVLEKDQGGAYLSTGGGAINVSDSQLEGLVTTGGGSVNIHSVRGGLVGSSGSGEVRSGDGRDEGGDPGDLEREHESGDTAHEEEFEYDQEKAKDLVNLRLAEPRDFKYAPKQSPPGFISLHKAGGEVNLESAPRGADVVTGGGRIRIGLASGDVSASTGGGSIDLGPVAGSVWAGTGSGTVKVRLADAGGEPQIVDLWSGTGNMIVELPPGLDARFELQAAYTESFGRAARIDCAWDLDRSETTRWDDREGTPRRYVRAGGVVGSGRGLIRIHTVNGDIQVQRAAR